MKQHITVEQLGELKDKEELVNWALPKGYCQTTTSNSDDLKGICVEHLPLLSIGQMIEFLDEEDWFHELYRGQGNWREEDIWTFYTTSVGSYETKELCDALWEAVKEKICQD